MMQSPRIIEASFLTSAQGIDDAPAQSVSEVVFLGRSNVGKSATLNALTRRKGLAKSSATPGKTRLVNFFDVAYVYRQERLGVRFVDLPGFGYAKVSKSIKEQWQKQLRRFIQEREAIRLYIHLHDARHPQTAIDRDVAAYVATIMRPDQRYVRAFTKIDKLNQKERHALKRLFPEAITLSNTKHYGHEALHHAILEAIFGLCGPKEGV